MSVKNGGLKKRQSANASGVKRQDRTGARKDKRMRMQHRFWCDLTKDAGENMDSRLMELKKHRKFQPTVIQALQLFFDLQDGKTDVLRELFPGIIEVVAGDSASAEFNRLLLGEVRQLRELVDHQTTPVIQPTFRPTVQQVITVEDIPDVTVTSPSDISGGSFAENLLNSTLSLFD